MGQVDYALCFEEAVRKAFAAESAEARKAYLDLASFYRSKLPTADLPGLEESILRLEGEVYPAAKRA